MNRSAAAAALVLGLLIALPAQAQVTRTPAPGGFPISAAVSAPAGARLVWISGTTAPPSPPGAPPADTAAQTVGALTRIRALLSAEGMGLGDVVMMRVYLVADAATGKMDFAGMMKGYNQFFGTPAQPNRPARTTVQVAGLAGPGALVEIEVQAAK